MDGRFALAPANDSFVLCWVAFAKDPRLWPHIGRRVAGEERLPVELMIGEGVGGSSMTGVWALWLWYVSVYCLLSCRSKYRVRSLHLDGVTIIRDVGATLSWYWESFLTRHGRA
jgi:hypothetical protein